MTPSRDEEIPLPDGMARLSRVFCGCVTKEATWGVMLAELERLDRSESKGTDDLASSLCDHLRLSEHGTSIRGGWLTPDGKEALEFLRKWGIDWEDKGNFIDKEGVSHGKW